MSATHRVINRTEIARCMWRARHAPVACPEADEAADWAIATLPTSRAARRLKIARLLAADDAPSADAVLMQGLLARPNDPSLLTIRAQRLLAVGQNVAAREAIQLVLHTRPKNRHALLLAAAIERAMKNYSRAATLLQRAVGVSQSPHRELALAQLTESLLEAGNMTAAHLTLQQIPSPPAELHARVLIAQGKLRVAANLLARALLAAQRSIDRDNLLCQLIDTLERIGDTIELERVGRSISAESPHAQLRICLPWLEWGWFRKVILTAARFASVPQHRSSALILMIAAADAADRPSLAKRALRRLLADGGYVETEPMAEAWRRALIGRLLNRQCELYGPGSDPPANQLGPLLHSAAATLEIELKQPGLSAGRMQQLARFRSNCTQATRTHPSQESVFIACDGLHASPAQIAPQAE